MKIVEIISVLTTLFSITYCLHTSSENVCAKTGLTCSSDCQQVILCMPDFETANRNMTFKKFFIEKCPLGSLCDPTSGLCTKNLNGCPLMKKICTGVGLFPDAYNCNKYHVCTHEHAEPIIHTCPSGFNYSASGACLQKSCNSLPSCSATQVNTALDDNPSLYLVCENQIFPRIYRCPSGIYDTLLGMCIDPIEIKQFQLSFECKIPGTFPTFDSDCYEYIHCTDKLKAIRSRCLPGYRFDQIISQCVKEHDSMLPCNESDYMSDFKEFRFRK